MEYHLSREDLLEHLREQIEFLRLSAAAFDNGMLGEAKRLASTLRVLLHQTAKSHSVLTQLGEQSRLGFVDTSPPVPDLEKAFLLTGFVGLVLNSAGMSYQPPLGSTAHRRSRPFADWWTETVVVTGKDRFSRKDFVIALANRDGGSHVDRSLDGKYLRLAKHGSLGFTSYRGGEVVEEFSESPAPYAVRQITFEVLETLEQSSLV